MQTIYPVGYNNGDGQGNGAVKGYSNGDGYGYGYEYCDNDDYGEGYDYNYIFHRVHIHTIQTATRRR